LLPSARMCSRTQYFLPDWVRCLSVPGVPASTRAWARASCRTSWYLAWPAASWRAYLRAEGTLPPI